MRDYLRLVRFPLVFTAVADSWAGYFISFTSNLDLSPVHLLLLAASSGALYMSGMLFNDLADLGRDRTLHPGRVLPSGRVGTTSAIALGIGLCVVAMACAFLLSHEAFAAAFAVIFLSFLYNHGTKRSRIAGSINMGLVRAVNFLMGTMVYHSVGGLSWSVLVFPIFLFSYVFVLTMISTLEEGESRKALFFSLAVVLGLIVIGVNAFTERANSALYLSFLVAFGLVGEAAVLLRGFSPANVGEMIMVGVVAIIPFDAIIVVGQGFPPRSIMVFSLLIAVIVSFGLLGREKSDT